jgi:RNA polymerase Rpb2
LIVPPEPFGKPKYSEDECRDRDTTYAAPLTVKARLINKETGEIIEKDVFMGDFPMMTKDGTFIISGTERVVVSQLVRSPGVHFTAEEHAATGKNLFTAKLNPNRGAWLEFETSNKHLLTVRIDRKPDTPPHGMRRVLGSSRRLANRHCWSTCSGPLSPSVRRLLVGFRVPPGTCQRVVQNIERRIVITIKNDPTTRTDVSTHRERLVDTSPAL